MPDIYTPDWYEAVRDAINSRVSDMEGLPEGSWNIAVDILGDGVSPYVDEGAERNFVVRIEGGRCAWYKEVGGEAPGVKLDFRFRGPAKVFDEIAAGLLDPIDAALRGTVKAKGDMRFLMRQAEHVQVLLSAYTDGVETLWPLGSPPYEGSTQLGSRHGGGAA